MSAYWSRSRYGTASPELSRIIPSGPSTCDGSGEFEEAGDRLDIECDGAVDLLPPGRRVQLGEHLRDAREVRRHRDVGPEVDRHRCAVDAGTKLSIAGDVVGWTVEHRPRLAHRSRQLGRPARPDHLEPPVIGVQLGPRPHEPAQPPRLRRCGEGDEVGARPVATEHRRRQLDRREGAVGLLHELVDLGAELVDSVADRRHEPR